jgi:Family of unknown function (DUF6527)
LKWLVAIWRWLTRLVTGGSIGQKSAPYRTFKVHDALPSNLEENILYVVEDDGYLEQAAMLCPCGCGRALHMNLLTDERPCWRLTQHTDGTATLYPSVWRKKDCGSHIWFRKGQVFWCHDRMSE